jgi:hypothetical protein
LRGYNAPRDQPYVPLGVPENVLPVIEGLKYNIEHSMEMQAETQKLIQRVKRTQNPIFLGDRPERTIKIMNRGIGANADLSEIQKKKRRSKQKFNLASDHIDIIESG